MRLLRLRTAAAPPPPEPSPWPERPIPPWRRLLRPPGWRAVREGLRRNPGLKLLSLLLAFLLWFSINATERDAEREVQLPVAVRRLAPGLVVTNVPPHAVTTRIRGPRTILEGVDASQMRLAIDLSASEPGERTVKLNADMVRPELPRRLKIVRLDPPRLKVRIERLVPRRLPVRVEVAGLPAMGYRVEGASATPAEAVATGPASKVEDLKELKTEPVDVGDAAQPIERKNVLLSWAGDFVTFSPDHVTVQVAIEEAMMARQFPHLEVRVLHAEGLQAQLVPPWVDLTVSGPQRVLHNYAIKDGAAYVDAAGLGPGTHQVNVQIDLPSALMVTSRKPEVHRLRLTTRGGR
jgi:YbbR domain-containing protein